MLKGFKSFVMREDVITVAVGFVMALAFSNLVKSFTDAGRRSAGGEGPTPRRLRAGVSAGRRRRRGDVRRPRRVHLGDRRSTSSWLRRLLAWWRALPAACLSEASWGHRVRRGASGPRHPRNAAQTSPRPRTNASSVPAGVARRQPDGSSPAPCGVSIPSLLHSRGAGRPRWPRRRAAPTRPGPPTRSSRSDPSASPRLTARSRRSLRRAGSPL